MVILKDTRGVDTPEDPNAFLKKTQQKTYHSKKHKINSHTIVSVAARLWIYITKNLCVCVYLYIYIYHKNVHQFAGEMRKSLSACFHQNHFATSSFPPSPPAIALWTPNQWHLRVPWMHGKWRSKVIGYCNSPFDLHQLEWMGEMK